MKRIGALVAWIACTSPSWAFTVKSLTSSIGHEFLTVEGAHEARLGEPAANEVDWQRAACLGCDTYGTKSHAIWSMVMGNRYADLNGWSVVHKRSCFDATAQDSDWVQYAHFLRRRDDTDGKGLAAAWRGALDYIRGWFDKAVKAQGDVLFLDGGGEVTRHRASRAHFYLGIALHAVQDSFSTEHTERSADFRKINDIKSFVGTPFVAPHACPERHLDKEKFGFLPGEKSKLHGDYPFETITSNTRRNLKPSALAAVLATADLIRAFRAATAGRAAAALFQEFEEKWFRLTPHSIRYTEPQIPACIAKVEGTRIGCLQDAGREPEEPNLPRFNR